MVPHRSTNQARQCLTSLSRQEAVLSLLYGHSCCKVSKSYFIKHLQPAPQPPSLPCLIRHKDQETPGNKANTHFGMIVHRVFGCILLHIGDMRHLVSQKVDIWDQDQDDMVGDRLGRSMGKMKGKGCNKSVKKTQV